MRDTRAGVNWTVTFTSLAGRLMPGDVPLLLGNGTWLRGTHATADARRVVRGTAPEGYGTVAFDPRGTREVQTISLSADAPYAEVQRVRVHGGNADQVVQEVQTLGKATGVVGPSRFRGALSRI